MSLEQYKELAVQEQRYPKNPISKLVSILQSICTFWTPTPLEKLLIDDDDTFKKLLTLKYSTIEHIEGVGEVHSLIIPHPLNFTLTLDSFASFVQQFLIQKGFKDRKVILVGHSYGTQIVLKLLNRLDQGKVVGAVMIAPPKFLFKRNWLQNLVLKLLLNIPFVFQCFRKFDRVNNVHSVSLRRLFANVDEVSDYHKFKQFKFNLSTNSTNILTQALNWKPISSEEEVIQAFQRLTIPLDSDSDETAGSLLIIDGDTDKVTHNGGSSYKDFLGNSNVEYSVVEKAGHNLMLERADELK
ncbi:Lipid droplet hydrolase 1 [Cyberlindnera fabianii]|uniref:Lipid droplet hydrolase 1 n=1 Tax=Cyberlindnera fabianii TaxID=36022 RepID=A0A1V2L520_CYBFA|nr:Lipid droplet hydrolase 1 [Cyberlindnera fabianii]